ncbi:MAG: hypothetical protein AAF348_19690, partial [Bacteroidota bacterium]
MKNSNKKQIPLLWAIGFPLLFFFLACGQSNTIKLEDYAGFWKGNAAHGNPFEITVTITNLENPKATMVLSNEKELFREAFALKDTLAIQLDDKLR